MLIMVVSCMSHAQFVNPEGLPTTFNSRGVFESENRCERTTLNENVKAGEGQLFQVHTRPNVVDLCLDLDSLGYLNDASYCYTKQVQDETIYIDHLMWSKRMHYVCIRGNGVHGEDLCFDLYELTER